MYCEHFTEHFQMDIVQVIFSNQIIPLELYLAPCPSLAETALRLVAFFCYQLEIFLSIWFFTLSVQGP